MQIKRFEAEDMTEALRMVKREFGDDAVILSAKETRPGGFFSAFRKKCVEITAATDYHLDSAGETSDFSKQLSEHLDAESENDRVSLSTKSSAFTPFGVGAQPPTAPKGPLPSAHAESKGNGNAADRCQPPLPVASSATDEPKKTDKDERLERHDTEDRTSTPFYRNLSRRKIIALVGAHGTGKSTAIAKLAVHCHRVEKRSVALVSLDRFSIGAGNALEKVSQILKIPFSIVRDTDQLQRVLDNQKNVDVVLIDTPGLGAADAMMVDDIATLLETANPDETHLVVNATVRQTVINAWMEKLKPLGIDRLFFTHVDEYAFDDRIWDLIHTHRLPSTFYADGADLFDHLKETRAVDFSPGHASMPPKRQQITNFPTKRVSSFAQEMNDHPNDDDIQFVANRNSELFHHPDCKSVKRINAENITAFNSIEQAMEEGFKPCRACCNNELLKKALSGLFTHRRVSAI